MTAFSTFAPQAARIETLFWVMFYGSAVIVALVLGATLVALAGRPSWRDVLGRERTIVGAGVVLPVVVLTALLFGGFRLLAIETAPDSANALRIAVIGEQWWWRIRYLHEDGSFTETANEIHLPVGRPVELELTTADVIHSFWVPSLGGKVDMIPGHVNRLVLEPSRAGVLRAVCAEYCGGAHALMGMFVVVESAEAFEGWLALQQSAAAEADPNGRELFVANGCGACHRIRGTEADGTIGPDLTHVGGRLTIGAGVLRTSPDAIGEWIRAHRRLKPGNLMPPFGGVEAAEAAEIAAYLAALE